MKKPLAMLMALMLLLPAAALADTINLDAFTFELPEEDLYIQYEKAEDSVVLFIYPSIDWEAEFRDNISVSWSSGLLFGEDVTTDEMAENTVSEAIAQLEAANVAATHSEILDAALDAGAGTFSILYRLDVDYSPMGINMQITLYFYRQRISVEGDGTYTFALTSNSEAGIDELREHLDSVRQP